MPELCCSKYACMWATFLDATGPTAATFMNWPRLLSSGLAACRPWPWQGKGDEMMVLPTEPDLDQKCTKLRPTLVLRSIMESLP